MKKTGIKHILRLDACGQELQVEGWVRTKRESKEICFLEINDGSTINNLQVILDGNFPGHESIVKQLSTGCSVLVTGNLIPSPARGQVVELKASSIDIIGTAPPDYILQKKRHTLNF